MIILIDNKNYMVRLCENNDAYIGIDESYPNWKGEAMFYSDIGEIVVLSGDAAEEFLDEKNIYYIHVETIKKENFERFVKRMNKLIEERKDLIENTNTSTKLIFGINKEEGKKATAYTDNAFEVLRELDTDNYTIRFDIDWDNLTTIERVEQLEAFEEELIEHFGYVGYGVEEYDFYEPVNFCVGKSIKEVIAKFHMFIAINKASIR